jgi:hypothetical protein
VTIEIVEPEIEAIIRQRLATGAFEGVEDVVAHALRSLPPAEQRTGFTAAELLAIMQASPCKEIDIEPARSTMPVRDVTL